MAAVPRHCCFCWRLALVMAALVMGIGVGVGGVVLVFLVALPLSVLPALAMGNGQWALGVGPWRHCVGVPAAIVVVSPLLFGSTPISPCEQWLAGWVEVPCWGGSLWGSYIVVMKAKNLKKRKKKLVIEQIKRKTYLQPKQR